MEIWRDVKGFEGRYQVSSGGNVRSLLTKNKGEYRVLNADNRLTQDGYRRVSLRKDGVAHEKRVCRLVAENFIPNPNNKETVNHKNGVKTDDRLANLEWATRSENMRHAYELGLKKPMAGRDNPNAKLTDEQVEYIRKNFKSRCRKNGASALARKFGVTHRVVLLVAKNESYNKNV